MCQDGSLLLGPFTYLTTYLGELKVYCIVVRKLNGAYSLDPLGANRQLCIGRPKHHPAISRLPHCLAWRPSGCPRKRDRALKYWTRQDHAISLLLLRGRGPPRSTPWMSFGDLMIISSAVVRSVRDLKQGKGTPQNVHVLAVSAASQGRWIDSRTAVVKPGFKTPSTLFQHAAVPHMRPQPLPGIPRCRRAVGHRQARHGTCMCTARTRVPR